MEDYLQEGRNICGDWNETAFLKITISNSSDPSPEKNKLNPSVSGTAVTWHNYFEITCRSGKERNSFQSYVWKSKLENDSQHFS